MASIKTERALRIADGTVVVALAVISLASLWWLSPNPWIGVPQGILAIMLLGLMSVSVIGSPGQLGSNPVAGLLPALMALMIVQFYEAETAAQSRTRSV